MSVYRWPFTAHPPPMRRVVAHVALAIVSVRCFRRKFHLNSAGNLTQQRWDFQWRPPGWVSVDATIAAFDATIRNAVVGTPGKYDWTVEQGPRPLSFVLFPKRKLTEKGRKRFPLVSFTHGLFGSEPLTYIAYSGYLRHLVSHGYVVVVTTDCGVCGVIGGMTHIQLSLIKEMKDVNTFPSKSRKLIDFKNCAVAGHSMGGGSVIHAAQSPEAEQGLFKAAIAMHPAPLSGMAALLSTKELILKQRVEKLHVPTFISSGLADFIVPWAYAGLYYNAAPLGSRLVVQSIADHNYPGGPLEKAIFKWQVKFLDCHLKQDKNACKETEQKMCNALWSKPGICYHYKKVGGNFFREIFRKASERSGRFRSETVAEP